MRAVESGCRNDAPWMDTPERRALDSMRRNAERAARIQAVLEKRAQKPSEPCSASPERRAERHAEKVALQRKKAKRKQGRR